MAEGYNKHWLRKWLKGEPHFIIGGEDRPYLKRWFILPRNRFVNVYLHKFCRSDDDRALHDHPWTFISLIIKGGYVEYTVKGERYRRAGSVVTRKPRTLHRVQLLQEVTDFGHFVRQREQPAWTLFITGPRVRDWGFDCGGNVGWRQWEEFGRNGCD